MTLRTPLCDLLGIEHPILLAGMGGVSYAELAAAVSNAGGYGVLGMAGTTPDFIRDQMREVRALTDKPFGVDLLAATPDALTASVEVIIEEGASSFIAGLGVPSPIIARLKAAGLKVMVVCGAVKHAVKAEQAGCDAVICQGGEGGGHTGLVGTLPLAFHLWPELAGVQLLGVPLPWWLLGVLVYPTLLVLGWAYVRRVWCAPGR